MTPEQEPRSTATTKTALRNVTLRDVTVKFDNTTALAETTMEFSPGCSVALVGRNGSGKTTLLKLLAGLLQPTTGSIKAPEEHRVSYVGQHQHHHSWMPISAGEVLQMSQYQELGLFRRFGAKQRTAMNSAAERLGMSELLNRPFGELSGGQRQRLLVASAVAKEPDLLLLDEPITGLDIPSQDRILTVIDAEKAAGRTVVLSTHHLDEARHCDQVVLLANRVVATGPPEETLSRELLTETFGAAAVGSDPDSDTLLFDHHGHGDHARAAMMDQDACIDEEK